MNPNISTIVSQITSVLWQVFGLAFFLSKFGVVQRIIPTLQALELVYIAAVFWLARGGKVV